MGACPSCKQNAGQPLLARPRQEGESTKASLLPSRAGQLGLGQQELVNAGLRQGLRWGQGKGC